MNRQSIRAAVRGFLQRNSSAVEWDDHVNFFTSGLIDSLALLGLVSFVESNFDVDVTPEDLVPANFCSIDAITAFVAQRLVVRN